MAWTEHPGNQERLESLAYQESYHLLSPVPVDAARALLEVKDRQATPDSQVRKDCLVRKDRQERRVAQEQRVLLVPMDRWVRWVKAARTVSLVLQDRRAYTARKDLRDLLVKMVWSALQVILDILDHLDNRDLLVSLENQDQMEKQACPDSLALSESLVNQEHLEKTLTTAAAQVVAKVAVSGDSARNLFNLCLKIIFTTK
ncbi:hypothetical protein OSTOST_12498 [Ostertagia ostertagi]